jgi:hypothetical protein
VKNIMSNVARGARAGPREAAPREMRHFLVRAKELHAVAPMIAYYLRLRSVEVGMTLTPRPKEALNSVLEILERTKRSTPLSGDTEVDYINAKKFALDVYDRADRLDRANKRSKEDLKRRIEAFSAASTFLQMLEHFEEHPRLGNGARRDEDARQRREFAEWRAFDLTQALQLGRAPTEVKVMSAPPPAPVVQETRKSMVAPPPVQTQPPPPPMTAAAPPPPPPEVAPIVAEPVVPSAPPPSLPLPSPVKSLVDTSSDLVSVEDVPEVERSSAAAAAAPPPLASVEQNECPPQEEESHGEDKPGE